MLRRPLLSTFALALHLSLGASLGCASIERSYRDMTPEPPPALSTSAPSPEADALITRFYGPGGADERAIAEALGRAPGHAGLHEIAGYDAMARADTHAAFEHFLAAAADLGAVSPELYLWEMRMLARSTTEHLRAQALLRELAARHPKIAIRKLAAFDLSRELRRLGEYEEAEQLVRGIGFIDAWRVLGAFDNDQGKGYQTDYAPEHDPDLGRTYTGMRLPIQARALATTKLDGALPLGDAMYPADAAVAYAETFVTTARARPVDLRLTTTNAVRVWLNGKQVAADDKIFHDDLDNVVVRLSLPAGQSRILVKSAHETGPFRLAARVTEVDGSAPADLRFTAAPQGPVSTEAKGGQVSPLGAIEKIADENRRRFLTARLWEREGHARRAAWYLEPLLAKAHDNRTIMLFTAAAMIDNGEAGKALDVMNRGIASHPEALGFLLERARFYRGRRLWDKAHKDLDALIARAPAARDARMERVALLAQRDWTIDRCLALDDAAAAFPDDTRVLAELGRCKLDRAYVEDAERTWRKARALAPGETYVLERLLDVAERRVDYGAAEALVKELRAARPTSPVVLIEEAELYRREGKRAEAEAALVAARDLSPDAPWAYERLAQLAHEDKKPADAERWWKLALERDPDNVQLAQRLATFSPASLPLGDRLAPTPDDIERAVRSADKVKVHPGSHQVILLDDEVVTVHPDGSSKRIVTLVAQAVTSEGRDALIQARLSSSGRVALLEAFSVKKNGERQEASSIQGGTVRFRALDVGSIVVLQYAHYAPPPHFLPNEYVGHFRFQVVNGQIESSRWRLILPKDKALNVETRGHVERSVEEVGDQKVWSFSAKAVPPLLPEPSMTPAADELWMAAVSTLPGWDAYAGWEKALLAEAFQPSAALDALARKIAGDATTPRQKIDRLWAHVAQEIRYQQDYEDTIAGVRPHAAGMVVERGYGDCKDKAVLMIRLAKALGIEIRFALLRTTQVGKVLQKIPNQQFNHAIVYVPKQAGIDEPFFIDTTTNGLDIGNMRTDDEGALSMVIDPESGRYEFIPIPYQSVDKEVVEHAVKIDLSDPAKAVGHDHFRARGSAAVPVRRELRNAAAAKRFYQGLSDQLFSGTTLISGKAEHEQDLMQPVSVQLEVDLANAVREEDDGYHFDVPLPFPLSHAAALATREHPLRLWRGTQKVDLDVDLGEGRKASHVPPSFHVDHPCFSIARTTETKGAHVTVHEIYKNTCAEIAPADYPAFRAAVQKAVAHTQDRIVFGGKPVAAKKKP